MERSGAAETRVRGHPGEEHGEERGAGGQGHPAAVLHERAGGDRVRPSGQGDRQGRAGDRPGAEHRRLGQRRGAGQVHAAEPPGGKRDAVSASGTVSGIAETASRLCL